MSGIVFQKYDILFSKKKKKVFMRIKECIK